MSKLSRIFCCIAVMSFALCLYSTGALAADDIKVGVLYGITGKGSAVAKVQLDGVKLAIKQVNDNGGLMMGEKKVKVEPVIRDSETKPDVGVRRVRELVG